MPISDLPAIVERLAPFARVTVECHPLLVGPGAVELDALLEGRLEVAMGLETIHPRALPVLALAVAYLSALALTRDTSKRQLLAGVSAIAAVYPNPFSSNTTITYQLPASSNVELCIYDISGRIKDKDRFI